MDGPAPIPASERIDIVDTTRGIAVLGILLMNIVGFAMPYAYEDPTNWGGHEGLNLFVWRVAALFFEGTMRGLFTVLFGASVVLFLERHRMHDPNAPIAKLYYRRTLWLIVFGLVDAYLLLWDGDILLFYSVIGLTLYFFRNLSTKALIAWAAVVFLAQMGLTTHEYVSYSKARDAARAAEQAQFDAEPAPPIDRALLDEYETAQQQLKPSHPQLEYMVDRMRASYRSAFSFMAERTSYVQVSFFLRHGIGDLLSFMLLGMALLKAGVLTGHASHRTYVAMTLSGYALGLGINMFETALLERADFSVDALMFTHWTYDLGRLPMTLGHIGAILLIHRHGLFTAAQRTLAAVGRMALTNYLAQSTICLFVFTGAGLALYGQLQRVELYYVVAAIWLGQLIWSPLWLAHFRFGPMEWLWRRLTYGKW